MVNQISAKLWTLRRLDRALQQKVGTLESLLPVSRQPWLHYKTLTNRQVWVSARSYRALIQNSNFVSQVFEE